MNENAGREQLRAEVERGHFARAAVLAEALGLTEEEIHDYRLKALWQMSAVYRNAPGTHALAQQYGLSKKELRQTLDQYAEEKRLDGDNKPLEPCYDPSTGKYLTFAEWLNHFMKNWDRLSQS